MPASTAEDGPVLSLDRVAAGYGRHAVLSELSLSVRAGQALALLGPNGAGKSTAARIACGLMRPRAGQVRVLGLDPARDAGARRRIGLAPQETALLPGLTVRETLSVFAAAAGATGAERRARVDLALDLAVCAERADQRIEALSGGWRRRANLAAAMVGAPALLVLDEPTEGVDAATRMSIAQGVRRLLDQGAACLIISHDADFVHLLADRIGVLWRGLLLAEGPIDDLLQRTFGAARTLTVRFRSPPPDDVRWTIVQAGLAPSDDALIWTLTSEEAASIHSRLSTLLDRHAGEVALSRPGLDALTARLTEAAR